MTVSTSATRKNTYTGNASTTAFDFTFRIFAQTDLVVTLRNTTTGVLTTKTLTTHYTVSGTGNTTGSTDYTSGTVTMLTAPSASEQIIITSAIPAKQLVDYTENDAFPASSHEAALDKLTLLVQELAERSNRGISTDSVTADTVSTVLTGTPTAGQVVGVNAGGTGLAFLDPTAAVSGLGDMSQQTASAVAITGGTVTGITDITVADGGTGRSVTVAYTPICGGTTTTGAMQSVASIGSSGQVLTSNGAGALPTFQTPTTGGWTLISTLTASASSTLAVTGLTSGYKRYHFELRDLVPSSTSAQQLSITMGRGGSPTYDTNGWYGVRLRRGTTSGTLGTAGINNLAALPIGGEAGGAMAVTDKFSGFVEMGDVSSATAIKYIHSVTYMDAVTSDTEGYITQSDAFKNDTTAITAVKFFFDVGNITSGNILVYGIS